MNTQMDYDLGYRDGLAGKAEQTGERWTKAMIDAYLEGYEAGCEDRKLGDLDDKHRANLSEGW